MATILMQLRGAEQNTHTQRVVCVVSIALLQSDEQKKDWILDVLF
jgi:hypothetical protein